MTLSLPVDIEHLVDDWHTPAVYALWVTLPDDFRAAWNDTYESEPDFVTVAENAQSVIYVGATADLLSRLEDHRNGDVRKAALVTLAEDVTLRSVWTFDDKDRAFERESKVALALDEYTQPNVYIHQR